MSESDIDMDRAMQGIDDADSHVPKITWTNCAEQMPKYNRRYLILKLESKNKLFLKIDVAFEQSDWGYREID